METEGSHPYGVQPEGNLWLDMLSPSGRPPATRRDGFGRMQVLQDETVLSMLSYLDGRDLAVACCASKALYVYTHQEDLWRTLVLVAYGGAFQFQPQGWKSTFVAMRGSKHATLDGGGATVQGSPPSATSGTDAAAPGAIFKHTPLQVTGLYSDLLFKSWLCAAAAVDPSWLTTNNIDRRSANSLTPEAFVAEYELPNRPVIITDCASKWPAAHKWSPEYFVSHHGDVPFDAGGFQFTMRDYFAYAAHVPDDQPLYLFDKQFLQKIPSLAGDYEVPPYFSEDLFAVLGACRPDFRWLIAGPKKSGSVFHKDPNATSAWNACITGSKKWIMFPPDTPPPGVHASADGSEVATALSVVEWMVDFYRDARKMGAQAEAAWRDEGRVGEPSAKRQRVSGSNAREGPGGGSAAIGTFNRSKHAAPGGASAGDGTTGGASSTAALDGHLDGGTCSAHDVYRGPMEATVQAGEIIFVPRGWWHLVLNLEDSIAITQNYVSTSNLPHVLTFLRDMRYAVSGVEPEAADTLHERFVSALAEQRPAQLSVANAFLEEAQRRVEDAAAAAAAVAEMSRVKAAGVSSVNARWNAVLAGGERFAPACSSGEVGTGTGAGATTTAPQLASSFSFGFFGAT